MHTFDRQHEQTALNLNLNHLPAVRGCRVTVNSLKIYGNGRHTLKTADKLDRHISETADMARSAMASLLTSLHGVAHNSTPGDALKTAGTMQATVHRMEDAMSAARHLIDDGDKASASVDCARVMALSDYAERMAKLRTIAAQIEAQSGKAS